MINNILPVKFKSVSVQGSSVIKPERLITNNNEKSDYKNLSLKEMSAAIQKAGVAAHNRKGGINLL